MKCNNSNRITIGFRGENIVETVDFPVSDWIEKYGEGTVKLYFKRPQDYAPYAKTLPVENGVAKWLVTNTDLRDAGIGAAQLNYYVGDALKKSEVFSVAILKSIDEPSGDDPDPWQSIAEDVMRDSIAAQEAARIAAEASASASESADRAEEAAASLDEEHIEQTIKEYLEEHPVEAPVQSVNGKKGNVVLSASDVHALPDSTVIPDAYDDTALRNRVATIESKESTWNAKQDKLIPGDNITIQNGVISASGGGETYDDTAIKQRIAAVESGKVDKVSGKGLSTNDYDNAAKAKVDAIPVNPKYTDTVYDDTALAGRVSTIEGKEATWNAKYTKPSTGIPASDLASGVIPTKLPSPGKLTLNGAVSAEYDGSGAVTVTIPEGGGVDPDAVNSLIDATPIVVVSDTEPTSPRNRVWVKPNTERVVVPTMDDIPDALPNPNALTFSGAAAGNYDGSAPLSIEIPEGGGEQWEIIAEGKTTEDVQGIEVSKDKNGNDFVLKKAIVEVSTKTPGTGWSGVRAYYDHLVRLTFGGYTKTIEYHESQGTNITSGDKLNFTRAEFWISPDGLMEAKSYNKTNITSYYNLDLVGNIVASDYYGIAFKKIIGGSNPLDLATADGIGISKFLLNPGFVSSAGAIYRIMGVRA